MSASESGRLAMPASSRMFPFSMLQPPERPTRGKVEEPKADKPRPKLAKATPEPPRVESRTKAEPRKETQVEATSGSQLENNAKAKVDNKANVKAKASPRVEDVPPSPDLLKLQKHSKGWALLVDDLHEPAWIVSTKKAAVGWAEDAARFHGCTLEIYKTDGSLQHEKQFAA